MKIINHHISSSSKKYIFSAVLICLALLLNFWVLSVGSFNLDQQYMYSKVFFNMWNHLTRLSLEIDKSLIGHEAFNINGLITTYYLPFPALIRGIQSLLGLGESATLSSLFACLVYLISLSNLFFILIEWFEVKSALYRNGLYAALIIASPILPILALQTIATETIIWGCALFFASMVCSLRISISSQLKINDARILFFSILCGCTLFVRAPYSLAVTFLYFATLGMLVNRIYRNKLVSLLVPRLLIPILLFVFFLGGLCAFNYLKWGNPFEFYNLKYYIPAYSPEEHQLFLQYGALSFSRIFHNLSYYFIPYLDNFSSIAPFFKIGDSNFFNGVGVPINYREPAYPIPLMMPIYFFFFIIGVIAMASQIVSNQKNRLIHASVPAILSAMIPPFVILFHHANALRYSGEFIPIISFFAMYAIIMCFKKFEFMPLARIGAIFSLKIRNLLGGLIIVFCAIISIYFGIAAAFKQNKLMGRYEIYYPTGPAEINEKYVFGGRQGKVSGISFLGKGWSDPEVGRNWSSQNAADLSIPVPYFLHSASIEITANALVTTNHPEQLVEVYVNGELNQVISLNQPENNLIKLISIDIHKRHKSILEVLTNSYVDLGFIKIEFKFKNAISPKELRLNDDERKLAIDLVSLTVLADKKFEKYPLGQIISGGWQIHK